jgi:carboxylesterase type B
MRSVRAVLEVPQSEPAQARPRPRPRWQQPARSQQGVARGAPPAANDGGRRAPLVVTLSYRLGLLGYLGSSSGKRGANLGLTDQVAALEWVRRNISAFGGDASSVTVFGESAGGDAVVHLMATPNAPALFSRAIIQSAPFGIRVGREKMTGKVLEPLVHTLTELARSLTATSAPATESAPLPRQGA